MSLHYFLIVLLSLTQVKAQDNRICECSTDQDVKENEHLWDLLNNLAQLAEEVPEEQKVDYAVSPGNLYQFECNCEEKMRKRRQVEQPMEVENSDLNGEKKSDEEVREKRNLVRQYITDYRCPKGTYRFAKTCVPIETVEESEETQ